jgi:hypothetical protein
LGANAFFESKYLTYVGLQPYFVSGWEPRERFIWSSRTGNHSIDAQVVREQDTSVHDEARPAQP